MESLLLRGLEPTLRYWLKSFSREQFRLWGRSIQLYDLDLDGDALHASLGLPPTLRITQARVSAMELRIASITNVHREPIVVSIDELELVISEKLLSDLGYIPGTLPSSASSDGSGYGYSDKLADGMTVRVGRVHVILETKGGTSSEGRATRTPEVASITMRNLELYTTNDRWEIVPLNQAREFSTNRGAIYVFKKLEWESLTVDLLPPKDVYTRSHEREDPNWDPHEERTCRGERLFDKVSGSAYITVHRTELNQPYGLEVQIHIPQISCPRLSEPGLQAFLRFMTGVTIAMNREDANVRSIQSLNEAGRKVIGLKIDHIFMGVKDSGLQLEVVLKLLHYVQAGIVEDNCIRTMAQCIIGSFAVRDTSTQASLTLIQPSMRNPDANTKPPVPAFANEKLWPRVHPYESWMVSKTATTPMLSMYTSQITPSPASPTLASQMVLQCNPLKIIFQEKTFFQIASLIAECVVLESAVVLPDKSLHAAYFTLKELELSVPINGGLIDASDRDGPFTGVRLRIAEFMMAKSPFLNFRTLELDKDPGCSRIWKGNPVDSSNQRWVVRAAQAAIALETGTSCEDSVPGRNWDAGLWHCVEMSDLGVEAAMLSADGKPLMTILPAGGIVRIGISCKICKAHVSKEQYNFLVTTYRFAVKVADAFWQLGKSVTRTEIQMNMPTTTVLRENGPRGLLDMAPTDTAVIINMSALELTLLTYIPGQKIKDSPLVAKLLSWEVFLSVNHKSLAGAAIVTSKLHWQDFQVECIQPSEAVTSTSTSIHGTPTPTHMMPFIKNHVSSNNSLSRSSEESSLTESSVNSSRSASMERIDPQVGEIREPPQKEESEEEEELSIHALTREKLSTIVWIGKDRSSMSPVQREGMSGDSGESPQTPFLDINVETVIPSYKENLGSDHGGHKLQVVAKVGGIRSGGSMCHFESLLHRYGVLGPGGVPGDKVKKLMKNFSNGPLGKLWSSPSTVAGDTEIHLNDKNLWDVSLFEVVDLDIQLLDWLYALEGIEIGSEPILSKKECIDNTVKQNGWYTTFRCLQFVGRGNKVLSKAATSEKVMSPNPVQNLIMRIEGIQAVKHDLQSPSQTDIGDEPVKKIRKLDSLPNVTTTSGLDLEVALVERGDEVGTEFGMGDWIVESFQAGVQEPVKIGGTRQELEAFVELCKAEIKAASRVAAGLVKLFEAEPIIPQSAIEHLSDLGSSRLESALPSESKGFSGEIAPSNLPMSSQVKSKQEKGLADLEHAILTSQSLCTKISNPERWVKEEKSFFCCKPNVRDTTPVAELRGLQNQINIMKALLTSLKTESASR